MINLPKALVLASFIAASFFSPLVAVAGDITVFAAASLKTALDQAAADWQAKTGNKATVSCAGTAQLAQQIQNGAAADLFLSASKAWMDNLSEDALIDPDTRVDHWGNTLVLVTGDAAASPVTIDKALDLVGLLKGASCHWR